MDITFALSSPKWWLHTITNGHRLREEEAQGSRNHLFHLQTIKTQEDWPQLAVIAFSANISNKNQWENNGRVLKILNWNEHKGASAWPPLSPSWVQAGFVNLFPELYCSNAQWAREIHSNPPSPCPWGHSPVPQPVLGDCTEHQDSKAIPGAHPAFTGPGSVGGEGWAHSLPSTSAHTNPWNGPGLPRKRYLRPSCVGIGNSPQIPSTSAVIPLLFTSMTSKGNFELWKSLQP